MATSQWNICYEFTSDCKEGTKCDKKLDTAIGNCNLFQMLKMYYVFTKLLFLKLLPLINSYLSTTKKLSKSFQLYLNNSYLVYREQTARSMVDIQALRDDIPNSMCNNT